MNCTIHKKSTQAKIPRSMHFCRVRFLYDKKTINDLLGLIFMRNLFANLVKSNKKLVVKNTFPKA